MASTPRLRVLAPLGSSVVLAALAVLVHPSAAEAGVCPVPECVPGEIIGAGGTIPSGNRGIAYRATQGKYVSSAPSSGVDDAGDPIPPRYYGPNAEIVDDAGNVMPSSLDDDLADPTFKVLKPAGELRDNFTYRVRYDRECAQGTTQPAPVFVEVTTTTVLKNPANVGTLEATNPKIETRDVPNPDDAGACTVKKEVSSVHIKYTPAPELVPFAKTLGFRASLDGIETGPLKYQIGNADGTFETDVYVECPTDERTVKAELLVRRVGDGNNLPPASVDVKILPCGGGAAAGDAGADGGTKAADVSGCSCDTGGTESGTAGLSFLFGAAATAMLVRTVARKRAR